MRAIKTILFHLLRTFRGLFLLACKLLSGVFLLGFGIALFSGDRLGLGSKISLLALAVGFGALAWYYDMLMLKLKPDNVELTLFQ
ncbi:hypothetical protein [Cupriavidus alkaliphilus]|uniref:hypothetical protein n=1 Tax=Cupriavidus alkaliphilus TaxID=942866 RepID=UPI001607D791|nr:hypothetical protein [Cupriavidus alkaliphilus]MBB2918351.1 hypothetical protein [Cupriavidus alkaliphilus]